MPLIYQDRPGRGSVTTFNFERQANKAIMTRGDSAQIETFDDNDPSFEKSLMGGDGVVKGRYAQVIHTYELYVVVHKPLDCIGCQRHILCEELGLSSRPAIRVFCADEQTLGIRADVEGLEQISRYMVHTVRFHYENGTDKYI
jgi:hypothetical protein